MVLLPSINKSTISLEQRINKHAVGKKKCIENVPLILLTLPHDMNLHTRS